MKNETLLFMLRIYIFTLFLAYSTIVINAQLYCAYGGMRCFPFSVKPCCFETDACQFTYDYYECTPKAKLGSYCQFDGDCINIRYAKCSPSNQCFCNPNYIPVNETTCGTPLGNFCGSNDTCAMKNSKCIDNKCQCIERFVPGANNDCVPPYMGMACKNDSECSSVLDNSICSYNRCRCQVRYKQTKYNACGPILNVPCFGNDTCVTDHSMCIDNICQCKPHFSNQSLKCLPEFLGGPCQEYKDCANIEFSECSAVNRCVCLNRYVKLNETACRPILEGLCSEDNQCIVKNSICIDATCQCKPHYTATHEDTCILTSLGKSCQFNTDCDDYENLKCSDDKICACKDHYSLLNGTCIPIFNGFCSHNFECKLNGFHCVDNKCQCKPDFTLVSEHQCAKTNLVSSCIEPVDCGDLWHAKCIKNKCVCTHNHVAINNSTCYPISGGLCWTDHQCPEKNFECVDFHCKCKKNYLQLSDNSCIPKKLFI